MKRRLLLASLALCAPAPWAQGLAPQRLDEDRLRAAFVLRFAQFTQWPTAPEAGEVWLCVAGIKDNEAFRALSNRPVGEAVLRVRQLDQPRDVQAGPCQVLLLGHADAGSLRTWVDAMGQAPVLVVATSPEAMRGGAVIGLISDPQGMAFSVNQGEARKRNLTLAAPVLKLAREIR
jgi:YfiR/HmsC-like